MGSYTAQDAPATPETFGNADSAGGSSATVKLHSKTLQPGLTGRNHKLGFVRHIVGLAMLGALPALALATALLWTGDFSRQLQWTLTVFVVLFWLIMALVLRHQMIMPLRTLSNLISSLREGDYSLRGVATGPATTTNNGKQKPE